jgi:hypothetical protein
MGEEISGGAGGKTSGSGHLSPMIEEERVTHVLTRICHPCAETHRGAAIPLGWGILGRVPGGVARDLALPPATSYNACGISPPPTV